MLVPSLPAGSEARRPQGAVALQGHLEKAEEKQGGEEGERVIWDVTGC